MSKTVNICGITHRINFSSDKLRSGANLGLISYKEDIEWE